MLVNFICVPCNTHERSVSGDMLNAVGNKVVCPKCHNYMEREDEVKERDNGKGL